MPYVPQDVLDRLAALERQVRQLAGRANIRPALNQVLNGNVVIGEGGQLLVQAPGGPAVVQVGKLYDDRAEFGTVLRREDGSIALGIYNGSLAPDDPQGIRIKDAGGRELFAEDVKGGGLARPYLPLPLPQTESTSAWPGTTSTSWTTLARSHGIVQHPYVRVSATPALDSATNGQIRLVADGTTLATGAEDSVLIATAALPSFTWGATVEFELQARRTAGTGTVRAMTRYLYGVQSP
ncbi:hypothetical protein ACH4S9_46660 [Streptomyces sp. NPDC021225]|uniref:hypothetical protein n=1 Tax=Streptomyces sp. NPDC021225 TaxID=3365121 RepID=UPI00378DEB6D